MKKEEVRARIEEVGIIPAVRLSSAEDALFAAEAVARDVFDSEVARECIDAGAMFLTSPGFDHRIVEFALGASVAVLPGALTPSEVARVWKSGADFVKVFPCALIGGENYIRALKAPFPNLPLIASGGVNQANAASFILAGASALGIGGELIPKEAIRLRQADRIFTLAHRFVKFVQTARNQMSHNKPHIVKQS
jgi:2-dehydro-3-deoxyphosphogluconate aldolase / (4S)-4-hydroxy-2-oxoglutarate aldolase